LQKIGGLYLVVRSTPTIDKLRLVVEKALKGGANMVQLIVEDEASDTISLARDLLDLTKMHGALFLINGSVMMAKKVEADGMHFDSYDTKPSELRRVLGSKCIIGYTLGVNLEKLSWAEAMGADYVSFCSVFPSSYSAQCPSVSIEILKKARTRTSLPIFAAGGINRNNAKFVMETGIDGIAVTSAILRARYPEQEAKFLQNVIHRYRKNTD
jgi:thiamine-phosphate pyrophosphorylase